MNRNILLLFFYLLFTSVTSLAQTDPYTGSWRMEYLSGTGISPVSFELKIGSPERGILYPAYMLLECDSFKAGYQLLLVRKSSRELGISRNKYPATEIPFSLGNIPAFLNGIFDYSKNLQGAPSLTIKRMESKQAALPIPGIDTLSKTDSILMLRLVHFLKETAISLKKINSNTSEDEINAQVLSPYISKAYFGLQDTIVLQTRDGLVNFTSNKKTGEDIVSVMLNGHTVFDQVTLNKKTYTEDILLDTGLNILTVFAETFGNMLPNKGKLDLEFGNQKTTLDFNNKADSAATFIVAKLYCNQDKSKVTDFQNNSTARSGDNPLQKNEKLVASIISTSRQVTLAIWDDAAEDGDSVSINIDGRWIVQGFPVKKNPQFLTVILKPGPNTITFIADNLGSIPPNTSVLEIIDGKKRKAFTIETTLGESNLIKIFYEVTGD